MPSKSHSVTVPDMILMQGTHSDYPGSWSTSCTYSNFGVGTAISNILIYGFYQSDIMVTRAKHHDSGSYGLFACNYNDTGYFFIDDDWDQAQYQYHLKNLLYTNGYLSAAQLGYNSPDSTTLIGTFTAGNAWTVTFIGGPTGYTGSEHYAVWMHGPDTLTSTLYYDLYPVASFNTAAGTYNQSSLNVSVSNTLASGADENRAQKIYYRIKTGSTWGSWTELNLSSYTGTITLSASTSTAFTIEIRPGCYKRNRKTSSSTPSLSSTLVWGPTVSRNFTLNPYSAPSGLTVSWPANASTTSNRKTTYNLRPWVKASATSGIGNSNIQLQYRTYLNGAWGSWTNGGSAVAGGSPREFQLPAYSAVGSYQFQIRAVNPSATSLTTSETNCYITIATPPSVSAGNSITKAQMDALRTAIINLNNYYGLSYTIDTITAGALARNATSGTVYGWNTYYAGANNTPKISDLAAPGAGVTINASYYNSYGTKLLSG